jgi:hypothetical protein
MVFGSAAKSIAAGPASPAPAAVPPAPWSALFSADDPKFVLARARLGLVQALIYEYFESGNTAPG